MIMKFKDVDVDAGLIIVTDASLIENKDFKYKKLVKKLSNGTYKVNVKILGTWNGNVLTEGILKVTTGKIIVTDPCYIIKNDNWDNFLERNFDMRACDMNKKQDYINQQGYIICNNMGGDGCYTCRLSLEKIEVI
jgi:hypothetical protein